MKIVTINAEWARAHSHTGGPPRPSVPIISNRSGPWRAVAVTAHSSVLRYAATFDKHHTSASDVPGGTNKEGSEGKPTPIKCSMQQAYAPISVMYN
jgi:hypothetical protein